MWRTFGEFSGMSSQSHVSHCRVLPLGEFTVMIPESHATLQGAVTWRNQCHDRATLQGVRIPSVILKNRFSAIFFAFLMQFGLWQAAAFVSSPIYLFDTESEFHVAVPREWNWGRTAISVGDRCIPGLNFKFWSHEPTWCILLTFAEFVYKACYNVNLIPIWCVGITAIRILTLVFLRRRVFSVLSIGLISWKYHKQSLQTAECWWRP